MKPLLLIVDDDPAILAALEERFAAGDCEVSTAADGDAAVAAARRRPDVVLLDLQLPRRDGMEVLGAIRELDPGITVIVITAHGSVQRAVAAMKAGAYDFLEKPFEPALLDRTVQRALERTRLRRSHAALVASRAGAVLIAESPAMREQLEVARKAAASDATVLITGESGTGKELVAQQVHAWSARADGPLVAVNCTALSETLLESELFGHEKGAFTGATERRPGRIELAHRGTLFLDEIGDVSAAFQAKLLRVLQERRFERVGGRDTVEVDVRVVAATNRDLAAEVAEGRFREDLFYRLDVIRVHLPPLRERGTDAVRLAEHLVTALGQEAGVAASLTDDARARILAHPWPGNVRELRNAIERALVLCEDGRISGDDLPPEVIAAAGDLPPQGFHKSVEDFRRDLIRRALAEAGGNRTAAAKQLGLQRTYLARLIRQYGLS